MSAIIILNIFTVHYQLLLAVTAHVFTQLGDCRDHNFTACGLKLQGELLQLMGLTHCHCGSGLLFGNVGSHLASDTEEVSALSGNRHDLPGASKSAEDPGELEYFFIQEVT